MFKLGSAAAAAGSDLGGEMYRFISELYPICRSITGEGFRETLRLIQKHIPLTIHEVPSGTRVFDWTVPREWNIRDAYIKNARGERIVDFKKCNLHVISYSIPIHRTIPFQELKEHLYTLPDHPDWIPYRTSYYKDNWGFCLTHRQMVDMQEEAYEVCIDTSFKEGHLSYGECCIPGKTSDEILVSCHACHPSLCNDNLSGIAVTTWLAKVLAGRPSQYSSRFLLIPGTIGSITWLALHEKELAKIKHGFVVTGVGDAGAYTYKRSRRGDAEVDRAFVHVMQHCQQDYRIIDFFPYGYDERQYCSPAFNLPVGCFMRTRHGTYPQYHTSADNLDFVQAQSLEGSFNLCLAAINVLQNNQRFQNQAPKCEPQLGKRGLYRAIGAQATEAVHELALLWVLNMSDGMNSLLDIADRAGIPFDRIHHAAKLLTEHGLLKELSLYAGSGGES